MEELRKEFEKKTGLNYLEEEQNGQLRTHHFRPSYVKFLEQKLSNQVTEEELLNFALNKRKEFIDTEREQALPLFQFIIAQIFSHYILIPKE